MTIHGLILTGSAGFIGLNTLLKLVSNNKYDFIYSIDKMGYATKYNSDVYFKTCRLNKNIKHLACDINQLDNIAKLPELAHANLDILNFASDSHVDNSIKDPFSIYTQNASIPAKILEWIGKENWGNIKTFYHISTDEVYGDIELEHIKDKTKWFTKQTRFNPSNPYSASKVAQDCFLLSMRHTFKIPVKFIRLANQFGEHQHSEKMVPFSVLRVLKNLPIQIYGAGNNIRQWTPVDTSANIICDIVNEKLEFKDIIHLANKNGIFTNNEIVDKIITILHTFNIQSQKEYIEDRKGHDKAYALMTESYIDQYYDTVDFDAYLKRTIQFYINHKEKYLQ